MLLALRGTLNVANLEAVYEDDTHVHLVRLGSLCLCFLPLPTFLFSRVTFAWLDCRQPGGCVCHTMHLVRPCTASWHMRQLVMAAARQCN